MHDFQHLPSTNSLPSEAQERQTRATASMPAPDMILGIRTEGDEVVHEGLSLSIEGDPSQG